MSHATTRFVIREDSAKYEAAPLEPLRSPDDLERYWRQNVRTDPTFEDNKESLIVIPVSVRLNPLGWAMVSLGSISSTSAQPADVFRPVLLHGAPKFLLLHNHPSGDTRPSESDIKFTHKIRDGADMLALAFGDHVIVSPYETSKRYSFRENRHLNSTPA